jgi:hypothetical protein
MVEPTQLIDNMNRLEIHFLVDEGYFDSTGDLTPAELLAGLAAQSDARVRLALIAVLLQRSDFADYAHQALSLMDEPEKLTFKLYYTAAHYLQLTYANQLRDVLGSYDKLPDYFSEELKFKIDNTATDQLLRLAERHKEITGIHLNWYGTYNYAAQRIITRLKKERAWATV